MSLNEAGQLGILMIGAHPDDCDIKAGGVAVKYARQGHRVQFLSLTNGDTGHHEIGGIELAQRRRAEADAVARIAGIEYVTWDQHCGELMPTLENRRMLIRQIRAFRPDLIITHRPNDYHPDHRYTSQLVQDSCYLVTVPNNQALTPHLEKNPVAVYFSDTFKKPYPFTPDVAVDIDDAVERKLDMLDCHVSQMYEWLPYNWGILDQVPEGKTERREWLRKLFIDSRSEAEPFQEILVKLYGAERTQGIRYAEAFEACEYGAPLTPDLIPVLFPFF